MRKELAVIALAGSKRGLSKSSSVSQRRSRVLARDSEAKKLIGLSPSEKRRKTIRKSFKICIAFTTHLGSKLGRKGCHVGTKVGPKMNVNLKWLFVQQIYKSR